MSDARDDAGPTPQARAFHPERVIIETATATATATATTASEWTVNFAEPMVVSILDPSIVREIYADRGPRVIGRVIRQYRRKLWRYFGGELAGVGQKQLRRIAARGRTRR